MTLSTKVALIKNGLLQQYCPPLQLYGEPENVFCADFMGNPSMNFVNCHGKKQGDRIVLSTRSFECEFTPNDKIDVPQESEYVLGIRPEFVNITEDGLEATVISSLPSGMETTLSLAVDDITLAAVAFGSVDFAMDSKVRFNFSGNRYVLFDGASQNKLSLGSLKVIK